MKTNLQKKIFVLTMLIAISLIVIFFVSTVAGYKGTVKGKGSVIFVGGIAIDVEEADVPAVIQSTNEIPVQFYLNNEVNSTKTNLEGLNPEVNQSYYIANPKITVLTGSTEFYLRAKLNITYTSGSSTYNVSTLSAKQDLNNSLSTDTNYNPIMFSKYFIPDANGEYYYFSTSGYGVATSETITKLTSGTAFNVFKEYSVGDKIVSMLNVKNEEDIDSLTIKLQFEITTAENVSESGWSVPNFNLLSNSEITTNLVDNYYEITSINTTKTSYAIPGYYNNLPIKSISSSVSDVNAVKVYFPQTIEALGGYAGATNLSEVHYSYGVTKIASNAFKGTNLSKFIVLDSILSIENNAFESSKLSNIYLTNVQTVGTSAFAGCENLNKAVVTLATITLGDDAFDGCTNLSTIIVDSSEIASLDASNSRLIDNASTVYVKSDLIIGKYINSFEELTGAYNANPFSQVSSNKTNYLKFNRNYLLELNPNCWPYTKSPYSSAGSSTIDSEWNTVGTNEFSYTIGENDAAASSAGPYFYYLHTYMADGEKYRISIDVAASRDLNINMFFEGGYDSTLTNMMTQVINVTESYQTFTIDFVRYVDSEFRALCFRSKTSAGLTFNAGDVLYFKNIRIEKFVTYETEYGDLAAEPRAYTKTGYTVAFNNWYTEAESGEVVSSATKLDSPENRTIYAQWTETPISYTITYNGNGATGDSTANSSHIYDVPKALTQNGYTKTGYTFKNWNTKQDGTGISYADKESVKNLSSKNDATVTLYAQWTANKLKVQYHLNGGTAVDGSFFTSGDPCRTEYLEYGKNYQYGLTNPDYTRVTKTGYTASAYYNTKSDGTGYSIHQDNVKTTIDIASAAGVLASLEKGDVTIDIYIQWVANTYTITLDPNGGTVTETTKTATFDANYPTLPNATPYTKAGYTVTFKGWYTAETGGTKVTTSTKYTTAGDTTLYAQYTETPKTYTLTIDANGGTYSGNTSVSGAYGSSTTVADPTRTGYTFAGWIATKEELGEIWAQILYHNCVNGTQLFSIDLATNVVNDAYRNSQFATLAKLGLSSYEFLLQYDHLGSQYNRWIQTSNPTTTLESVSGYSAVHIDWNFRGTTSGFLGIAKSNSTNAFIDGSINSTAWYYALGAYKTWNNGLAGPNTPELNKVTLYLKTDSSLSNFVPTASFEDADALGNNNTYYFKDETVTLKALWIPNTYTITLDPNGGTVSPTTATATFDANYPTLPTPTVYTKTGYTVTFKGWYTAKTGGTKITTSTKYTTAENTKIYAQYTETPKQYTITLDANGGTVSPETAYATFDAYYPTLPDATPYTKTGYTVTFKGWYTAETEGSEITTSTNYTTAGDTTIYAQWTETPISYTITYNGNGATNGSTADSSHTYDVSKALTTNGYTKTGYTFKNWNTKQDGSGTSYSDIASVKNLSSTNGATVTLYAQWTANTYTITYNGNGATGGSTANSSHTYDVSKALTTNGYTRTGYTFNNWNTKQDGTGTSYSDKESVKNLSSTNGATVTLYAQWTKESYTILFDSNGGTSCSSIKKNYGESITLPKPTRIGYTFAGWWSSEANDNGTGTQRTWTTMPDLGSNNSEVTVYAKWNEIVYTVTFNANGGSVTPESTTISYFGTYSNLPTPSRSGYTFDGWYTSLDFTTLIENGDSIYTKSNHILYANWYTTGLVFTPITSTGAKTTEGSSTHVAYMIGNGSTTSGNGYSGSATTVTIPKIYKGKPVTIIGQYAFKECLSLASITIPAKVTTIGNSAFNFCTSLKTITIPENVTTIGSSAFSSCTSLTSISFASGSQLTSIGDNAFYRCTGLTSITIPASVTSIGSFAFNDCTSLTSIEIPVSVASIGENPFVGCSGLSQFTASGTYTTLDNGRLLMKGNEIISFAPSGLTTYTIPSSVIIIGAYAFGYYKNLTAITIPNSVTTISTYAFSNCTSLSSITIPVSVTSIGNYAFFYSKSLTTVTMQSSTPPSAGESMFASCSALTTIWVPNGSGYLYIDEVNAPNWYIYKDYIYEPYTEGLVFTPITSDGTTTTEGASDHVAYMIGDGSIGGNGVINYGNGYNGSATSIEIPSIYNHKSVTIIGVYAFGKNTDIRSVYIPSTVTSIESYAFYAVYFLHLVKFASGSQLTSIGSSAFNFCYELSSITIPESVTSIGEGAFRHCDGLTSISFASGSKLTSIGNSAFDYCESLTSITIPESVTSIGNSAFYECRTLTTVTVKASTPPTASASIFNYCTALTKIIVPSGTSSTYKAATGWSSYSSKITES